MEVKNIENSKFVATNWTDILGERRKDFMLGTLNNFRYHDIKTREILNDIEMILGRTFDEIKLLRNISMIAQCAGFTTLQLLSELNCIITSFRTKENFQSIAVLDSAMNYLDIKYRGKRKEKYIMPTRNDAYAALLGELALTVDKDRINNNFNKDSIKDVIFNNPATIVIWKDGIKTVVKCQDRDTYSEELGLAMCIVKKCCQNKGNYNDVFNKWLPKEEKKLA